MSSSDNTVIYKGDIVAGALLLRESREIARLLLDNVDPETWQRAIVVENILQKRSPVTAMRQARLIRDRLTLMGPDLWKLVTHGPREGATQALLAAAIKHSRLVGDFLDAVVRKHWRTFTPAICVKDWKDFLETCAQVDPHVDRWTDSTRTKLRQIVFRMLAEARYIQDTRSLWLLPVSIVPEVEQYLINHSEKYVLRCMQVGG